MISVRLCGQEDRRGGGFLWNCPDTWTGKQLTTPSPAQNRSQCQDILNIRCCAGHWAHNPQVAWHAKCAGQQHAVWCIAAMAVGAILTRVGSTCPPHAGINFYRRTAPGGTCWPRPQPNPNTKVVTSNHDPVGARKALQCQSIPNPTSRDPTDPSNHTPEWP